MSRLIISTPVEGFRNLVRTSVEHCNEVLPEDLEGYLVFTLLRFMRDEQLLRSVLALDYLYALQMTGSEREQCLQDVGDKCLIFLGLFPKLAEHRRVSLDYWVGLGRGSYGQLADSLTNRPELARLYHTLQRYFVTLVTVLENIEQKERWRQKIENRL